MHEQKKLWHPAFNTVLAYIGVQVGLMTMLSYSASLFRNAPTSCAASIAASCAEQNFIDKNPGMTFRGFVLPIKRKKEGKRHKNNLSFSESLYII